VTDPDRRNIPDQRYPGDAELRYLAGTVRPRTHAQWLSYFREHYGGAYEVAALEHPGFHAHLVPCDAASPGGSAVMRLPGLEPGLVLV
jgi:hypothetical protein